MYLAWKSDIQNHEENAADRHHKHCLLSMEASSILFLKYKHLNMCVHKSRGGAKVFAWGGGAKCLATAAPALKKFSKHFYNGVGVLSTWTWLAAELTSKKKIKQIKQIKKAKKGGGEKKSYRKS